MKKFYWFQNGMWLTWCITVAITLLFSLSAAAQEPVKAKKRDTVKDHRYMESDVTLYRNGNLVISTKSWSRKNFNGLKNHGVFVVCVNDKGNAIWVSQAYRMTTIGGTKSLGIGSAHTDVNEESTPPAIGQYTKSIDIYHSAGDLSQSRKFQVEAVKEFLRTASDIAQELKEAMAKLL